MRIIDGVGEEVAVTGVGEIKLSSTGLRLAKPAAAATGGEESGRDETDSDEAGADEISAETTGGATATAHEKVVAFTIMKPLSDPDVSEKVAQVFVKLYEIVDGGRGASHVQGSVRIVVSADEAPALIARAEELGISVTSRDQ